MPKNTSSYTDITLRLTSHQVAYLDLARDGRTRQTLIRQAIDAAAVLYVFPHPGERVSNQ